MADRETTLEARLRAHAAEIGIILNQPKWTQRTADLRAAAAELARLRELAAKRWEEANGFLGAFNAEYARAEEAADELARLKAENEGLRDKLDHIANNGCCWLSRSEARRALADHKGGA